jgi:hypothetical protein
LIIARELISISVVFLTLTLRAEVFQSRQKLDIRAVAINRYIVNTHLSIHSLLTQSLKNSDDTNLSTRSSFNCQRDTRQQRRA